MASDSICATLEKALIIKMVKFVRYKLEERLKYKDNQSEIERQKQKEREIERRDYVNKRVSHLIDSSRCPTYDEIRQISVVESSRRKHVLTHQHDPQGPWSLTGVV